MLQNESDIQNNRLYENAFEWRFEFPALLSDDGSFVGFDIVIGNPPYIQLQANGGLLAEQLKDVGYETFARTGYIYCLFYERGLQLLCDGGIETYITSNKWMRAGYGEKTRSYFTRHNPLKLIDLGAGVFDSATVDTNILVMQKSENKTELTAATSNNLSSLQLSPMSVNSSDIWTILSSIEQSIKYKIESIGTPLKDWDVEINYGIKTGYNEAFIISTEKRDEILTTCKDDDERERTSQLIRPMLRGRDIKRYSARWAGLWLVGTYPALKLDINDYPALRDYLLTFGKRLHQIGGTGCRKKTNNRWFETQDTIAYYADFDKEKIIYREISTEMDALYSADSFVVNNKCYVMTGESLKYLICIMNSKAFNFYLDKQVSNTGGKGCDFFDNISVCRLDTDKQQPFIEIVNQILEIKRNDPQADTSALEAEIDQMVYTLYNISEKEIDFVEPK